MHLSWALTILRAGGVPIKLKPLGPVVLSALVLGACATTYQPMGFSGGYSETQLSENVFRVAFNANGYSSRERTEDFALLRSADLALEHGFTHFAIVDGRQDTNYGAFTTPTQTYLISKPSATNTVVLLAGNPNGEPFIYDAQFIRDTISSKYGIP
jgi:hypothetical protein